MPRPISNRPRQDGVVSSPPGCRSPAGSAMPSPAQLLRPGDAGEAASALRRLPVLAASSAPGSSSRAGSPRTCPGLALRIGVEEGARLGAEGGLSGVSLKSISFSAIRSPPRRHCASPACRPAGASTTARRAERQRRAASSAPVIQVAIHCPGEAHAAMRLDVLLRSRAGTPRSPRPARSAAANGSSAASVCSAQAP